MLTAEVYEKLGVFYLGREYVRPDAAGASAESVPVLYASKDLTTHAVCVGMTGSGKTGLCLALLEEAAIDQIPIIAIDPKGDVGNLLLTFPNLAPEDLAPWVDPALAEREGIALLALAEREAMRLREGLAIFGQDGSRIQRLRDSVEMVIYTPGSQAGRPLSLLPSFAPPSSSQQKDPEILRERVQGAVSGLLSLLGIDADPLRSREHILLSRILTQALQAGRGLDLSGLIRAVQKPSFTQVGVFELDAFYPAKERLELAMALNNLLAAPAAQAMARGEPLEIPALLRSSSGKPKLSIISIAHLNDAERMAFVTTLLSELIAWMRSQSGTSSLRALLYMDEIFGYFPPTAAPPSKQPMLTLLKQARAFGLGVVLATQNPVDLDYKGLANCGTWFIGRLQTERDKLRVLDGLEGAANNSGQPFDRAQIDRSLSGLSRRVFLLNNVHETAPRLIETRSTLSYLRGPVTRDEIKRLMSTVPGASEATAAEVGPSPAQERPRSSPSPSESEKAPRPDLPPEAHEVFFPAFNRIAGVRYSPGIYARAKLHFVDKKAKQDAWRTVECWVPVTATDADPRWSAACMVAPILSANLASKPLADSSFEAVPPCLRLPKNFAAYRKSFAQHLYQSEALLLKHVEELELVSLPEESPADFRVRLEQAARERRDEELEDLQTEYRGAFEKLKAKLEKAEAKLEREQRQSSSEAVDAALALALGGGLLGALLGRRPLSARNSNRKRSVTRRTARAATARADAEQAEQSRELLQRALVELERECHQEAERVATTWRTENLAVEERRITPRKADITVETLQLAWRPD